MDPQAHHIVQRKLSPHGCARISFARAARGSDARDRELDGRQPTCVRVTAIGARTLQVRVREDVLVIGSGAVAARLEGEAPC